MTTFTHDPQAVLDYLVDLTAWLEAGETITVATATPTGIVLNGVATIVNTGTGVRFWAAAPTVGVSVGQYASVTVHFTTSAGRQDDSTVKLLILDR